MPVEMAEPIGGLRLAHILVLAIPLLCLDRIRLDTSEIVICEKSWVIGLREFELPAISTAGV